MKKVLLTLIASFAFFGGVLAQYQPYWGDADPHYYGYNSQLVATMSIDNDIILTDDNYAAYEVAAFVKDGENEEFRGHGFMKYYEGDTYPILEFTVFCFLDEDPIPVYFKLYDHSTETLYDYCQSSVDVFTHTEYAEYDPDLDPHLSFFHTFEKVITPYTTDNGGYYFIASPVNGEVMAKDVVNLRSNNFDFYSFDQMPENGSGLEWINHRDEENYVLQSGIGYLYANSGDNTGDPVVLTFIGAPYDGDGTLTLEKKEGPTAEFSGWNLVGNPFAQKAYLNRDFYVMKDDGSEVVPAERDTVSAMEGIFVIAENDGEVMQFSTTPIGSKGQIVLNVTQNRGNVIDRAIIRFGEGGTLPKFMLNTSNTKMYIPKDGNDFAVVQSKKAGKLPVNFEPAHDGVYFINVNTEGVAVRYLHLIDHEEGIDVDLLQTPSYKFEARAEGKPNRFELVFKTGTIFDLLSTKDAGDSFGFCNNGNWIINNEGEAILQVVDVEGRILSSEEINGSVSKRIEAAPGVYMLRLINGKDMKVQKIVVE